MLNTNKLLYIMPDVAYVAELLPGKKEYTFVIQSFRQINGEFLDDNELLADNVKKLISKLDPDEYHLVLPDFLFTNTIVEIAETSESKIKEHLKDKLLPTLSLDKETHDLKTTILTEYGGKTKVQLSAIEKSVLNPIAESAPDHKVKITGISPLSWTVKSLISLEPSISVIQLGSHAYLAEHYIGVDQTISDSIENIETLGETIKTLKGAEPSIQTVYLLTNELVEEKLKEQLSDTLPLQQLTKPADEESQMPSYVKQVIEAGQRTLSIPDFPVPLFPLGKPVAVEKAEAKEEEPETETEKEAAEADLPAPSTLPTVSLDDDSTEADAATITEPATKELKEIDLMADDEPEAEAEAEAETKPPTEEVANVVPVAPEIEEKPEPEPEPTPEPEQKPAAPVKTEPVIHQPTVSQPAIKPSITTPPKTHALKKNPANSMVRMLLVSATVFLATVGIGVGLGLAVITLTQQSGTTPDQVVTPVASPSPTSETVEPTPSPSPSPEPDVAKDELEILVVNATTKAGYAGTIADSLEEAGFTNVTARNARGDYDEGNYVLMAEENAALISELESATDLTLEFSDETATEDSSNQYYAVVVLAE